MKPRAARLQRFDGDDLGLDIGLPHVRQPAAALLVFVLVSRIHAQESDKAAEA